jgi:hypothetical protein
MVSTMMRFAIVFFFIVKHLIFFIGFCENSPIGATFTEVHENAKTGEPIPMGFSLSKIRSPYCFVVSNGQLSLGKQIILHSCLSWA